ncbi:MAG: preprotein translocase subunit SecE [Clostridia bacterium]|jgi:preprotein translocase subunit SecE|nr:preprotein translocase subunit SecE [Clostridia bacterium]
MANAEKKEKKNIFVRAWSAIRKFFKGIFGELGKVTWPTKKELTQNTISVILFCLLVGIIIWVSDFLLQLLVGVIYNA